MKDKCHYLKPIVGGIPVLGYHGDEIYYYCELDEDACKVEYHGETCEEWEATKEEWENEQRSS